MSTDKGYIKVYRDIRDHWIWNDRPFSLQSAWIDLLLLANHEQKTILFNDAVITVEKGQHMTSLMILSERWGWSRGKTKRFLDKLESEHMITTKRNGNGTLLTIVKYGVYQDSKNSKRNTNGTQTEQQRNAGGHKQDTKEGTKEDIKKKEAPPPDTDDIVTDFRKFCEEDDDDDW